MKWARWVVCAAVLAVLSGCGGGGTSSGGASGDGNHYDPWPLAGTWAGTAEFRLQSGTVPDSGTITAMLLPDGTWTATVISPSYTAHYTLTGNWAKLSTLNAKLRGDVTDPTNKHDTFDGNAWGQTDLPDEMRFQLNVTRGGAFYGAWVGTMTRT